MNTRVPSHGLILATVISATLLCTAAADPSPTAAPAKKADLTKAQAVVNAITPATPVQTSTSTVTAQQAIKNYTSKPTNGPQTVKTNPVPAPVTTAKPAATAKPASSSSPK